MFRVLTIILLATEAYAIPQKTPVTISNVKELGLLKALNQPEVRQSLDAALSSGRQIASVNKKNKLR